MTLPTDETRRVQLMELADLTVRIPVQLEWHSGETAPLDRPIVICIRRADGETGEVKTQISRAQWGVMEAYPNSEAEWLPVKGDENWHDNAAWGHEQEFRPITWGEFATDEQIARHNDAFHSHACDAGKRISRDTIWRYRGWHVSHWTELYEVVVTPPPYDAAALRARAA